MSNYRIEDIGKADIGLVKPIWETLNLLHLEDSVHFKDHYRRMTFEARIEDFKTTPDGDLKISIARADGRVLGYCLSTIGPKGGEIESLCVLDELKGQGVGKEFVEAHIAWMKERGCARIRVSVAHGHESVLGFYRKLGFKERLITLEQ
jgi:ribosomal protein S18 acetylase RimI-like enzyme